MHSGIVYEQPLNERVRTFLRMEFLINQIDHYIEDLSEWGTRSALNSLLDITELLSRTDIKLDLIKDLETHSSTLNALNKNPGVNIERLNNILIDISNYLEELRDKNCQPGQSLRQSELISSLKQRNAILGGSCNFDLPAYHQWLHRPIEEKHQSLFDWQKDLLIIKHSLELSLGLLRNSTNPSYEKANKGFFQKSLEQNINCQLIRIILQPDSICFPEISAGKHRFTVRMMEQLDTSARPSQVDSDVDFELHCCIL